MSGISPPKGYVEVIRKINKPGLLNSQHPLDLLKAHWKTALLNQNQVRSLLIRSHLHKTTKAGFRPSGKPAYRTDRWHVTTSYKVNDTMFRTAHGYATGEHDFNPNSSTLANRRPQLVGYIGSDGTQPWPSEDLNPKKHRKEWYSEAELHRLVRDGKEKFQPTPISSDRFAEILRAVAV
ncbi:uncharacterized protein CCOS01_11267 [Colletotrichum costaricense]|uniref:Uncharacterized protein n=1 Tax=Colletotrichum costaricense TaxID=1209916 RepID=A0AAI9YQG3_9PEZI|nr:uncharacterized protein CCOS01_11267 [Colletotrichum costaricense]KAK1519616.1 hypothetical protein CCOS01_11267 [Colletotrichum costaricense]